MCFFWGGEIKSKKVPCIGRSHAAIPSPPFLPPLGFGACMDMCQGFLRLLDMGFELCS